MSSKAQSERASAGTILNVEDDPATRCGLSHLFRQAGYNVLEAIKGSQALKLAAQRPDLVTLDINLPDINGFEVCRRLKLDPDTHQIPILLLSGDYIGPDDQMRGLECGADGYLTKPIDPTKLLAYMRVLVRMRQSEERYRLLAENIPQLVWTSHTDGTIDYVNRRVAEYVGPEHQERRLWDWDRIVHPADLALALDRWRNALLTGKTYEAEFRLRRADGVYRSHMVRAVPVRGSHNRITQWLGTCTDIEEHRTLESQFRQSQKMEAIGQLASGVAHDFNNLLTVILGYSELMLGRLAKDDPGRELVAAVQRAGEQASALTGQLLAFSRKQVLAPRVIDLNGILANMQAMLRRLIGEDVDLHTKLDPGLLPVHADPGQLEQVVMNLAVNARDAMPHGGKLTIETRNVKVGETGVDLPSGPYVLLAVSDTGTGMTKEVRDHLFEPFFSTKEPGRGTGLGLATVFGIVKQSGGHITTQSEPGVGSTFLIYLPPAPSFPIPAPKSVLNIRRASMGTETLLLVEDDHAVRTLSRQVLAQSGYRVLEASGSSQALSIAAAHKAPIHLLVTDVVMPGQSGRVLAEQLTRLHPETSVLYLSGYTDDAVVRRGIVQAHVNFLQKPYSPGTFVRKVRNVLDEPRTN